MSHVRQHCHQTVHYILARVSDFLFVEVSNFSGYSDAETVSVIYMLSETLHFILTLLRFSAGYSLCDLPVIASWSATEVER